MPRHTKCLYCGHSANSNEHLFPATLGGRLTKKTLCRTCNLLVSPLDQEISNQLLLINSLLGVQGRNNRERMGLIRDSSGRMLLVDKFGQLENAECEIKTSLQSNGETSIIITGSERAVNKYLEDLRMKDILFKANERHRIAGYQAQPTIIPFAFGKPNGLREISRIALNFFEYFHPELARHEALIGLKKFILEQQEFSNGYILPRFVASEGLVPSNRFEFGHRIIICLDKQIQRAYSFVNFFSCIEFIVDFGHIEINQSATNIIDINPLEKSMSEHIYKHKTIPSSLNIRIPIADSANFEQDKYLDELEIRMNDLYEKINGRQFDSRISVLHNKLIKVQMKNRLELVISLIEEQRQTVLLLLHRLCSSLENLVRGNPRTSQWADIFSEFIKSDKTNPLGVSELTAIAMNTICERFSLAICRKIDVNEFTIDWLRSLLAVHRDSSGELVGAMICKEVIFEILKEIFGKDKFLRMMAAAFKMEGY